MFISNLALVQTVLPAPKTWVGASVRPVFRARGGSGAGYKPRRLTKYYSAPT